MAIARHQTTTGAGTAVPSPSGFPDDQLYMLKLCLELQLEAMLLALGSSAVVAHADQPELGAANRRDPARLPWQKWLAEDLDLASSLTQDCVDDGIPLPSSIGLAAGTGPSGVIESLAARYSAMAAVVDEMLERTDARQHPVAVSRLRETQQRCEARLDALLGTPKPAPVPAAPPPLTPPGLYLG
jgi:hypothetical protein